MDSASSTQRPAASDSIMSSYRRTTSYRAGSNMAGAGGGDEVMDASINLRDEVSFGGGAEIPDHSRRSTRKSLVDIFLADGGTADDDDTASFVGMQQTHQGQRLKKISLWLCLAVVLVIIFVTAPKPGFLFGSSSSSSADAAVAGEKVFQEEETFLPDTTAPTEEFVDYEEVEEEVEVTKPPAVATEEENTDIQVDMNRMEAIKGYIIQRHEAFEAELRSEESPAAKSLKWMVTEDTANLDVPGYAHNTHIVDPTTEEKHEQGKQLLQRYALAAFYFAVEPSSSSSGGAAGDDARRHDLLLRRQLQQNNDFERDRAQQFATTWATNDGSSVCDWFGVECNDDQHVVSLNVSHALLQG